MGLPVFFPSCEISLELPAGRPVSIADLCHEAGVKCRVTGVAARRPVRVATAPSMRAVRRPGTLSEVYVGVPKCSPSRGALLALGLLAYSAFDYAARETLRGLPEAAAVSSPGRPLSPRPLSGAERQRRYRAKSVRA